MILKLVIPSMSIFFQSNEINYNLILDRSRERCPYFTILVPEIATLTYGSVCIDHRI
jgi:hypothetical protein